MLYHLHYCRIFVEGLNQEKALNMLMMEGIMMTDVVYDDEMTCSFNCSYNEYSFIKKYLTGKYYVYIDCEYGIVPTVRNLLKRPGIITGIIIVCIMITIYQNIISEIRILNYAKIDETDVRRLLLHNGICEGCYYVENDFDSIENSIISKFPDIAWVNIERKGGCISVKLYKSQSDLRSGHNEINHTMDTIHNVVASRSGYVEKIIVKEGYPLVGKGDYVEKGQILISSSVPVDNTTYDTSRNESFRITDADGIIYADVIYKLSIRFEKGKYSQDEIDRIIDIKINEYIKDNIPEYIKMHNKDLKFTVEENIIEYIVTLNVSENIALQKENKLAEDGNGEQRSTYNAG